MTEDVTLKRFYMDPGRHDYTHPNLHALTVVRPESLYADRVLYMYSVRRRLLAPDARLPATT